MEKKPAPALHTLVIVACLLIDLALPGTAAASPLRQSPVPVASYTIQARLDVAQKQITGSETIIYKNISSQPIPDLVFHLYLNAFRSLDTIFMRETGGQHRNFGWDSQFPGWIEVTATRLTGGEALRLDLLEDGTLARAELPAPIPPGGELQITVDFRAQLPKVFARTGFAFDQAGAPFFMVGQWFPKLGVWQEGAWNAYPFHANSEFFADFGNYNVQITLPDEYKTAGVGTLAGERQNVDGTRTVSYHAENVIDFAWAASPNFQVESRQAGAVQVQYFYLPEHAWSVARVLDITEYAIQNYSNWFGPYAYPNFSVVDIPEGGEGAGGMEYPTLVTAGVMDLTGLGSAPVKLGWEKALEIVTAHEIAHQWWQSMVAFNEAEEPWLDEGFADYSAMRLINDRYGRDDSALDVGNYQAGYLDLRRMEYVTNPGLPMAGSAWSFAGPLDYGVGVYSKPALALTTLQNVLGVEAMDRMMSAFFERYQFAHPTTADFRRTAQEITGSALGWFFDGLVEGNDTLNYRVTAVTVHGVTVQRQGELVIPTQIRVDFADGEAETLKWEGEDPERTFTFPERNVQQATIDPDRKLLVDLVWSDNSLTRRADLAAWISLFSRLVYRLQDFMLALGGL